MAFLRTHSKNLYMMDELYSALQKEIRRGNVDEVLFFGGEFVNSGNPNPLWNRLFLIACEDVSIGQPHTSVVLWDDYNQWKITLKKEGINIKNSYLSKNASQFLIHSLKYITLSYKNRIINNSLAYVTATYKLDDIILPETNLIELPTTITYLQTDYKKAIDYLYKLFYYYLVNRVYEKAIFCVDVISQIRETLKLQFSPDPYQFIINYNPFKQLNKLFNTFNAIKNADLGQPRLILTFMVYLIINFDVVKDILDEDPLLPIGGDTFFYNDEHDIKKRRRFAIPNYAIDKHTSRGKGSKKTLNNLNLLEKEAKKRNIDISNWSSEEKQKSHGNYLNFADEYITQQKNHSAVSHFFIIGSLVTHVRKGPAGEDPYFEKALSAYLEIEFKKGYKSAKSTQILKLRWPSILKFIEQTKIPVTSKPPIPRPKIPVTIKPPIPQPKIPITIKPPTPQPKIPVIEVPQPKIPITIKVPQPIIPVMMETHILIPTIDNIHLEGLNENVLLDIKKLADACSHYKDNKNKIYNEKTKKCVTISSKLGQAIIKDLIKKNIIKKSLTIVAPELPIAPKLPTSVPIPTIDLKHLEGFNMEVINELKKLADACSHYKDNKNKIYNEKTQRCVTIDGKIGKNIIENLIKKYQPSELKQPSEKKLTIELKQPSEKKLTIELKQPSEKILAIELEQPSEKKLPVEIKQPGEKKIPVKIKQPGESKLPVELKQPGENKLPVDKESDRFNFIVRAQLVTSMSKMDTYYATDKTNGSVVFVKGPYLSKDKAAIAIHSSELKNILGINYIPVEMVLLQPDLLETPLGLRHTINDKSIKRPFLIFKNLCGNDLIITTKESKVWKPTPVVDWDKMVTCQVFNVLKEKNLNIIRQYIEQLLYRYIVGIGDLADRNFILAENKVYSVDEDSMGKDIKLCSNLKKKRTDVILSFLKKDIVYFNELISKWKFIIEKNTIFAKQSASYYTFILAKINYLNHNLLEIWKC